MTMATLPGVRFLEVLAEDPDATPERRAEARGVLAKLEECERHGRVVAAAQVVAAAWTPEFLADATVAFGEQVMRGEVEAGVQALRHPGKPRDAGHACPPPRRCRRRA